MAEPKWLRPSENRNEPTQHLSFRAPSAFVAALRQRASEATAQRKIENPRQRDGNSVSQLRVLMTLALRDKRLKELYEQHKS